MSDSTASNYAPNNSGKRNNNHSGKSTDDNSNLDMPPLPLDNNSNNKKLNHHRKSASINVQSSNQRSNNNNNRKNLGPRFKNPNGKEVSSKDDFDDDSYGTLNPNFQFGSKRRSINHTPSQSLGGNPFSSVPLNPLQMTPEQLLIQQQIEALQHQQRLLLQNQSLQNQSQFVQQFDQQTLNSRMINNNGHRRIQSQQVGNRFNNNNNNNNNFTQYSPQSHTLFNPQSSPQLQKQLPKGHGRRHSVNVTKVTQDLNDFSFPPKQSSFNNQSNQGHGRRISTGQAIQQPINNFNGVPDLATAQTQLASLAQFRLAAGAGGHHRAQSFAFPNAFQNMVAAASLNAALGGANTGGSNNNQMSKFNDNGMSLAALQQQQAFNLQIQQQNQQGPQRKSLFAPYLPQASLPPLLTAGKLVVGMLRVNKRNRSDAYISTEVLDADVYICGSKDRNRALEGDIVAVELLNVDEVWGTKKEKEEKKKRKEENAQYDALRAINPSIETKQQAKNRDDVEVEGQGLLLIADEEVTDEQKPKYAGHVVAIIERMPGQLFSGTLGILRPSSAATKEKQEAERREREGGIPNNQHDKQIEKPKIVWFKPTDKRVPLIAIPTEQAPKDFIENSESYLNQLFVACIKRWPITSLHPFGTLVEELGPIGDIEVETSALLKDSNASFNEDFSESVLKCLPPLPWSIPEREFEIRKDLRSQRTFTIDPDTAKDLDDAISINKNDDDTFDITVSIADVSYFVKPNSALDKDARKRATSVYLVQRSVPMLPSTLSSDLCSLIPDQDRLAFSVTFTMTKDARVIKTWYGKSIIKSCAQLTYQNAQNVIENQSIGLKDEIKNDFKVEDIENDIRILYTLSKQLRDRRFDEGALKIDSIRLSFNLNEDGIPIDCMAYQQREANRLIEEFMLLTNISVAKQIAANLPEQALLRRHENPMERRMLAFAERAKRLGYDVDVSSSGALQKSFLNVDDLETRMILQVLAVKGMYRAKYFCSGAIDISAYKHYALNIPLYTHFTSPIRRYADVIVHRQLDNILQHGEQAESKFGMDRETIAKIAQQCNVKKEASKQAQEASAHLYLCLLIADLTRRYGPVVREATVIGVLDRAFDIIVDDMGIEKRVHVDQIPIDSHVYNEHDNSLDLYWKQGIDVISWLADNHSSDGHLRSIQQEAQKHAPSHMTSRSVQDESALFDDDDEDDEDDDINDNDEHNNYFTNNDNIETTQHLKSKNQSKPIFQGIKQNNNGHNIQTIKEKMTVSIIVTADFAASPPILKCYCANPFV